MLRLLLDSVQHACFSVYFIVGGDDLYILWRHLLCHLFGRLCQLPGACTIKLAQCDSKLCPSSVRAGGTAVIYAEMIASGCALY